MTLNSTATPDAGELALARAVPYRLASLALRHPSAGWDAAEWSRLRAGLPIALEACGAGQALLNAARELVQIAPDSEELLEAYGQHFGHTPRAASTPYETEWSGSAGDLLQFHQLSDVSAFYKAFGLELARECGEREDHLSIELGFLHFLCVKEAYAAEDELDDLAAQALDAQRIFLAEHVATWTPAFCARLERAIGTGFYASLARFLAIWIAAECDRFQVEPGDPALEPGTSSVTLDDCCVNCDQATACPGPGGLDEASDG
ncbi:MAG: molecular chaperone TorD family protein [Myxococcota bacterium]|jgi:TorA maturation chaperone TorD|nr:molecular chaperone TorD family protein [Myxococcota bacterium]